MATPMSAPDSAILLHQPSLDANLLASTSAHSGRSIEELYDVKLTVERLCFAEDSPDQEERVSGSPRIKRTGKFRFERVALQFPDEILPDSVPIYWALKKEVQTRLEEMRQLRRERAEQEQEGGAGPAQGSDEVIPDFYILADTSYGNCCVDEVAAQHVEADVVVHYGHACLSPTARLPVIYVFPKQSVQVEKAASALATSAIQALGKFQASENQSEAEGSQQRRKAILFSYDVGYAHIAEEVFDRLQVELQQASSSSSSLKVELPPLVMTRLDTARNFEDRLRGPAGKSESNGHACGKQDACCQGTEAPRSNDACACKTEQKNDSHCNGSSCCSTMPPLPPMQSQTSADAASLAGTDGSGRLYHLPPGCSISDTLICYLGGESLALTNLLLRAGPATPVVSYDPFNPSPGARREDGRTNRLLMRRYAAVQKARDASVIGLLVGTLGVQSYLPLLSHLRHLLTGRRPGEAKSAVSTSSTSAGRRSARKVYTISVGKLSPAKLANFQEVELFVLLACPENSLVDAVDPTGLRSKEFYRPIVTPFEMMLALDESRSWTGEYVLDMERLINQRGESGSADQGEGIEEGEEDDDRPHFSLVTGGYVTRRRFDAEEENDDDEGNDAAALAHTGAVVVRSASGEVTRVLDSANAMHLATRSWKGLEQRLGMDEPSRLEEGREGIARGYRDADGRKRGEEAR
ncbi:hypothetical protein BCV69DRAFT_281737 [Microstroma glucosiphilum]|uniref:Diphthamide biosynthesis protein n=1 Tax=Pseudomicrostroma glucosiphilum TaxID=1684307 RepID=A0A316U9H2_9BASI|nr:hypothetical protein BCV69DRAFT_281737 [Pseudomicrostroma glucosiphilum]PWN21812.1 hypothetical protein BCV69DRAFT_281737 [Pseudomicrostroma glucosiphilum]